MPSNIQQLRYTTAARTAITFADGVLVLDTDQQAFYVGDGSTPGGIQYSALSITNDFQDTSSGDTTVNLPAGSNNAIYKVVNTGSAGNKVTVSPNGAELLFGANASFDLFDAESLNLTYQTGAGWW